MQDVFLYVLRGRRYFYANNRFSVHYVILQHNTGWIVSSISFNNLERAGETITMFAHLKIRYQLIFFDTPQIV